jgi:cytoskeletal protein RodZ
MESPGEYLKRERELRGVSLKDISEAIRVSLRLLEALEMDDEDSLPHPTYVKGFIKAYCNCLGLDGNDAVLRYEVYLKESPEKVKEGTVQSLGRKSFLSPNAMVAILFAIGVLTVALYFIFLREQVGEFVEPEEAPPGERISGIEKEAVELEAPAAKTPEEVIEKIHTLEIDAIGVAWIRVVIDDGDPFEVLLSEGESIRWDASKVFFY